MAERERKHHSLPLEGILSEFDISFLPPESLDSEIVFLNGSPPLSVRRALSLSPAEIVDPSLRIISHMEAVVTHQRRHGGDRRSSKEVARIRKQFEKERNRLLAEAPGEVLAAIAANPNKRAKWTDQGLKGRNDDWRGPERDESRWWGWVHGQKRKGVRVEDWWVDPNMVNFLHASFIMRCKRDTLTSGVFDAFVERISSLVSEDDERLVANLRAIAQHFNS